MTPVETDTFYSKLTGLKCNGSTTKLDTGSTADLTGDITVEAIINPVSYGESNNCRIIDNGKLLFLINTGGLGGTQKLYIFPNSLTYAVSSDNSILINDKPKHCIVTVTSAGVVNFYIQGEQSGASNQSGGTPVAGTTNILIGNNSAGDRTFDGAIKVVKIFNGIATPTQITERYNYWLDKG